MTDDGPVVMAMAPCYVCGRTFMFNPHAVPSIRRPGDDVRMPVCRNCVTVINEERVAAGEAPFTIRRDAYDPLPAEEL
jgi:hypothetical protein